MLNALVFGSRRSRLVELRVWMVLGAVVAAGMLVCGSAQATTGHAFSGQFGGFGPADGQFLEPGQNGPSGLAVMGSTGELFTFSDEQGRVQRFDAAGVFQSAFSVDPAYSPVSAIAADSAGGGAVYVLAFGGASPTAVLKYTASGAPLYPLDYAASGTSINFFGNAGLAVDPVNGIVYAVATDNVSGAQVIDSFVQSTGAFLTSFDGGNASPDGGFACPNGLAVDGSHRVYVLDTCKNRVDRYGAGGAFETTVDSGSSLGGPTAVGVDAVSDEVYVAKPGPAGVQVTHLSAGGAAPLYTFDVPNLGGVRAIAVSGAGTVYLSDATSPFVQRFTRFQGPTVVTLPPSLVQARSATLEATINPEGVASSYHFEYGTDLTYGSRTPETGAGSGNTPGAASALVSGLDPNLTYHYRVVGSNSSGPIVGDDQTLTTATAPPTVSTSTVSAITPRSASVHGTVNPNRALFASYHFEYGTTTAYGQSMVGQDGGFLCFGCGGSARSVAAKLPGLAPDTTYHYRVVASSDHPDGAQAGADRTFTTAPASAAGATDITTRRATLKGTINPHGAAATYHFNYGPTADYGTSTSEIDGGAGDGDRLVSQAITGLQAGMTYHVQVVASSDGVTRAGADGLFRTASAPTATMISPTSITTAAATLAADIDTHGLAGTYHFDLHSLDSAYTLTTAEQLATGASSAERVSAVVSGLPAGETFVVALTVSSNESSSASDQVTFATAPMPRVFPTVPIGDVTDTYGCVTPTLDAYDMRPKPGEAITISGHDLGVGGNIVLGDRSLLPTEWTATRLDLQLPDDAAGTLALTVNCGHRSNTIAITIFHQPDNRFSITARSAGSQTATLSVRLPGPGKLQTTATNTKATTSTVKKAGVVTIKVRLSGAGLRALNKAKNHRLKVTTTVRFTPAGGRPATKAVTVTYKRNTGR